MLFEQCATLTLGHAAPDAELDPVVQGVGATLHHHGAVPADNGSLALRGPSDEQLVGVGRSTQCLRYPGDAGFPVHRLNCTMQRY